MLGHIDILGDPLSLGMNISSGVIGFVKKVLCGKMRRDRHESGRPAGHSSIETRYLEAPELYLNTPGQANGSRMVVTTCVSV